MFQQRRILAPAFEVYVAGQVQFRSLIRIRPRHREIKGQNGDVETLIASNLNFTCTVNFAPNGASRAAAITSCTNASPAPLSKVALSGFTVAAYNGDWNSMGYSVKMSRDGIVTMSIKLKGFGISGSTQRNSIANANVVNN